MTHKESSKIFKDAANRARIGRYNTVLDVTLGARKVGVRVLNELRKAGYEVRLVGVTVGIEPALRRADARGRENRRFVDPKALIRTHKGFSQGFEDYAKHADHVFLVDTNVVPGSEPIVIASKEGVRHQHL